jgi:hypothetical protein
LRLPEEAVSKPQFFVAGDALGLSNPTSGVILNGLRAVKDLARIG